MAIETVEEQTRGQLSVLGEILEIAGRQMRAAGLTGPDWFTDDGTSDAVLAFRTIYCRALHAWREIEYSSVPEVENTYNAFIDSRDQMK